MRNLTLLGLFALSIQAQTLTVSQNPVPAGGTITIVLNNTSGGSVFYGTGETILLHRDGERTFPRFPATTDTVSSLMVGGILTQSMTLPATGPGSAGSYLLYNRVGNGACLRLDVGAPSANFPTLHAYPDAIYRPNPLEINVGIVDQWIFLNVSGAPHTFVPGDRVEVLPLGGGPVIGTSLLAGLTVPAAGRLTVPLPTAGLPAAPYRVQTTWVDPASGVQVRRQGIQEFATGEATVHFPGGRTVPVGGSLEAWCVFRNQLPIPFVAPNPHSYALMAGVQVGVTPLPGGNVVPLTIADPLVVASLTNAAFGALTNNGGLTVAAPIQGNAPVVGYVRADNIFLNHPGPALSGTVIRIAAVAFEPVSGGWAATQLAEVTLQ